MIKEISYHGYLICVDKEEGLTSFSVFRELDMWEIIYDFTYGEDSLQYMIKMLKHRVDEFIRTKGFSEGLDQEYTQ